MPNPKPVRTIVHLVHRLTVGGAERVLVNFINGSAENLRHVVCSFFPADNFAEQIIPEKRNVIDLHKNEGNDLSIPGKVANICRKYQADVIHCQGWGTYLEGLLAAKIYNRRTRFIFAFRGKTVADLNGVPKRRLWAQKVGSYFTSAIVTPSREMQHDYAQMIGLDSQSITVIPNGVNTELFCPQPDKNSIRRLLGIPVDVKVIGCVARFDPVKDIPGLIRSFFQCYQTDRNIHLLLVGDGPQMVEIKNEIKLNGLENCVTLAGRQRDVSQYLQAMDVYVQPSLYEGLSNTILEAMSTALPIIARDVGGTKEVVKTGHNGILLEPLMGGGFTDAMATLISNEKLCRTMGTSSRKIIENGFSMQQMVSAYDRLFSHV